jgi:hypothetical protein
MIKLFDIENGVIVPTEHCYTLKELKYIMDTYPDQYLKIYQYLFYMTCYDPDMNPFFNIKELERDEVIMQQLDPSFTTEDKGIQEALKLCEKLYTTATQRAYKGIKTALDNIGDYLSSAKITVGRDGNFNSIIAAAEKYDKIRHSFKNTERDLIEEQQSRVRGGGGLAYDQ